MDTEKLLLTIAVAAVATVVGLAIFYFFGVDQSIQKARAKAAS